MKSHFHHSLVSNAEPVRLNSNLMSSLYSQLPNIRIKPKSSACSRKTKAGTGFSNAQLLVNPFDQPMFKNNFAKKLDLNQTYSL